MLGNTQELQRHISTFIEEDGESLLVLEAPPEAQQIAAKLVASLESNEGIDRAFIGVTAAFVDAQDWMRAVEQAVLESFSTAPQAADPPLPVVTSVDWNNALSLALAPEQTFAAWLEDVARSLWAHAHGVVLIVVIEAISHVDRLCASLVQLGRYLAGSAVRIIVMVEQAVPALSKLYVQASRRLSQDFSARDEVQAQRFVHALFAQAEPRVVYLRASTTVAGYLHSALLSLEHFELPRVRTVWVTGTFVLASEWLDLAEAALRELDARIPGARFRGPPPECSNELGMEAAFAAFAEAMAQHWMSLRGTLAIVFAPQQLSPLCARAWQVMVENLEANAASTRVRYIMLTPVERALPAPSAQRPVPYLVFSLALQELGTELEQVAADNAQPKAERIRSLLGLASLHSSRKEFARAVAFASQALQSAGDDTEPTERALAWLVLGNVTYQMEEFSVARNAYLNATNLALDHDLDALASAALTQLGHASFCQADHGAAIECYRTAQLYQARIGNLFGACHALIWLGEAHWASGQAAQAEEVLTIARKAYESLTGPYADAAREGRIDVEQRLARVFRQTHRKAEADAADKRALALGGRGLLAERP